MENYKQFFYSLNRNIKDAKNKKTLKILEKQGRKYIVSIPDYADPKLKKECKKEFKESQRLIKRQYKKLK